MKITFDTIVSAADEKYDKLEIDVPTLDGGSELVVFGNPARLPEEQRDTFRKAADALAEDVEDPKESIGRIKGLLDSVVIEGDTKALYSIIGDDQALLGELLTTYFEAIKVGEASPSQS